jgi:hypothetical protein
MATSTKTTTGKKRALKADGSHEVELRILAGVYDDALTIGTRQGMALAALSRYAIFIEHARLMRLEDPEAPEIPDGQRPPLRQYGVTRKPLRFTVPGEPYEAAAAAIRKSGRSVSGVVEDFLKDYIETFTRSEK